MKRNRNSRSLALAALVCLLLPFAGCKKVEQQKHVTPVPKHPIPVKEVAATGAAPSPGLPPATAPASAPAPAPGPAPAPAPGPAVQQRLSSATKGQTAVTQFDFRKRTDPFKTYVVVEPVPAKVEQTAARRDTDLLPIQSVDVSKFKLVGIIAGLPEKNQALIVDPSGKGYVVQPGMSLGSNDGRITKITPSAVEVVELYKEGRGQVKKRKIVLTLAKKR